MEALTAVLGELREREQREGLQLAKRGARLPDPQPLRTLCANQIAAASAAVKAAAAEKRRRVHEAVKELTALEPLSARSAAQQAQPAAGLRTPQPKGVPATAVRTPSKAQPATPQEKKRKQPATPVGHPAKRAAKERAVEGGGVCAEPATPQRAARDIKTEAWNRSSVRMLMMEAQVSHDVHADYVMPTAIPANAFIVARKRRK